MPNTYCDYNKNSENKTDVDLGFLLVSLWERKTIIFVVSFVSGLLSVLYVLNVPNTYKSEALLAPAHESSDSGLTSLAGQFGGLASLAGVNLTGDSGDRTKYALAVMKSKEFLSQFIVEHDLLVALMAAKGWDKEKNVLVINKKIYDTNSNRWVRKPSSRYAAKPSIQEALEKLYSILAVSQNKETGFVVVSFEFYSPVLAKEWVAALIADINRKLRIMDVIEAESSIEYLNIELQKTSVADLRGVFYELIEEQLKKKMFANVREDYAFKIIDPPIISEKKYKPKRALICLVITLIGMVGSAFGVLFFDYFKVSRVRL